MTAQLARTPQTAAAAERVAVEQAIARGETDLQVAGDLHLPLDQVAAVRERLDRLVDPPPARGPIKHGTRYGHIRHLDEGSVPCEQCRAAMTVFHRAKKARARARGAA